MKPPRPKVHGFLSARREAEPRTESQEHRTIHPRAEAWGFLVRWVNPVKNSGAGYSDCLKMQF